MISTTRKVTTVTMTLLAALLSMSLGTCRSIKNNVQNMDVESLLSPAELKWYRHGRDGNDPEKESEDDDEMESDLDKIRKRIKILGDELSSIKADAARQTHSSPGKNDEVKDDGVEEKEEDDKVIDPKFSLSDAERKWMAGEDPAKREAKIIAELRDLKDRAREIILLKKHIK